MTKDEALRLAIESLCCVRDMVGNSDNLEYIDHQVAKIEAALEAKDEPVAWVYPEFWQHLENLNCGTAYRLSGIGRQPLYTTPPQRTWVELTYEEIQELRSKIDSTAHWTYDEFAKAIEAKLKEKNT